MEIREIFRDEVANPQGDSNQKLLRAFYNTAIISRLPIALWRLPGTTSPEAIIDLIHSNNWQSPELTNLPFGFLFAPFVHGESRVLFLAADVHLSGRKILFYDKNSYSAMSENLRFFFENFQRQYRRPKVGDRWFSPAKKSKDYKHATHQQFCNWVELAKKQIVSGALQKVVLSRSLGIPLDHNFEPLKLFQVLCQVYPRAFVSLVAVPEIGTWIGATPELMLKLSNSLLSTVALAGTKTFDIKGFTWGKKELKEQAFVSDYIREAFLKLNIKNFTENGPTTIQTGKLLHLKTEFTLEVNKKEKNKIASELLKALHPTPAVCGTPKQEALDFILNHEIHEREFYTGYLGPVNFKEQTHLFVNLRCLQLLKHQAILYAGSGITLESEPEKEWIEADLKLKSLLNFINGPAAANYKEEEAGKVLVNE